MPLTKAQARSAMNGIRFGIGIASFVAPRFAGRLFGIDPDANPGASYLGRLFGVREVFIAAVSSDPAADDSLFRLGLAVDGADYVAALAARARGQVSTRTLVTATLGAGAAMALGLLASRDEGHQPVPGGNGQSAVFSTSLTRQP